ncbi:MAG: hypothetical protein AAB491_01765 [Patescibacteria group bacterium]
MINKKYIILNFIHGNSPYLRTTELALAINDLLEKRGEERMGIIVPWVYKIRQIQIMKHNFGRFIDKYPDEILLDKNLGARLRSTFYDGNNYGEWLNYFLNNYKEAEEKIQNYISGDLTVETFSGKEVKIKKEDIAMEINRCPQINFGISPSYYASFGYMSEILERAQAEKGIDADKELFKKAVPIHKKIEEKQDLHFIAEPATFFYLDNRDKKYKTEISTPPNSSQSLSLDFFSRLFLRKGIYITVTGVYGLNHLFEEIKDIGLKVYSHKKGLLPFAKKAPPSIISHKNIILHFARVGWGSGWLSFFSETPLIALPFDPKDEPEVYFNNICLERTGLGKVYNGQSVNELLEWSKDYKDNVRLIKKKLMDKYGTLNGVEYTAEKIIDHYLKL